MRAKQVLGYGVLGGAMAALAGFAGAKAVGRHVRGVVDPALDDPLDPPEGVTHRTLRTADEGTLHLVEIGSGRPVLLLHGVTLQWWVWSATMRLLAPRFRVIAWDMRGHGRSVAGHDGVSMDAMARDVVHVLEELDLRDAVVVGHSLGGMVLGHFAAHHPDVRDERVGGLLFLATSAASLSVRGLAGGLIALSALLPKVSQAALRSPRLTYRWGDTDLSAAMVRGAFGRRATARMVDDVRRMLAECPTQTLAEAGAAIAGHDIREALAAHSVATTVVVGDEDRLTPPSHARLLAELVPGTELEVLAGVGHQVMQEAPAELADAVDRLAARSAANRTEASA
jgi:pimeloyl-ACP methyl ester carboxylesterase